MQHAIHLVRKSSPSPTSSLSYSIVSLFHLILLCFLSHRKFRFSNCEIPTYIFFLLCPTLAVFLEILIHTLSFFPSFHSFEKQPLWLWTFPLLGKIITELNIQLYQILPKSCLQCLLSPIFSKPWVPQIIPTFLRIWFHDFCVYSTHTESKALGLWHVLFALQLH